MKKILALVLLIVAVGALVATVARTRSATAKPGLSAKSAPAVDIDFTAFNDTMRSVKVVELMKSPSSFRDKTIRLDGVAVYAKDKTGANRYGLHVYDAGGCCPMFTADYLPASTNALPPSGSWAVLEGRLVIRAPPANPLVIISNATLRAKQLTKTTTI